MMLGGLCLALALSAALALRAGRQLGGRAGIFLRVIVPSWRFFDRPGPPLTLHYRACAPGTPFGSWQPLRSAAHRRLSALWLNPRGNLRLAYYGLLEHLMDELAELREGDADGAQALVSYTLVALLVRDQLPDELKAIRGLTYQFKLSLQTEPAPAHAEQEVLISALHKVE